MFDVSTVAFAIGRAFDTYSLPLPSLRNMSPSSYFALYCDLSFASSVPSSSIPGGYSPLCHVLIVTTGNLLLLDSGFKMLHRNGERFENILFIGIVKFKYAMYSVIILVNVAPYRLLRMSALSGMDSPGGHSESHGR